MVRVIKGASSLLKQMQERMNDPQHTENAQDTKDASSSDSESADTKEELQTTPSHNVNNDLSASGHPTKIPVTDQGVTEGVSASDTETIQTGDANNQINNNGPQHQSSSDVKSQPQDSGNVSSQPQDSCNVRYQPQHSSNANSQAVTSTAAEAKEKSASDLTTSESSDEKMEETTDPIKFEASWFDTSRRLYLEDFPLEDSGYVARHNGVISRQPQKPREVSRSPEKVLDQEPMDFNPYLGSAPVGASGVATSNTLHQLQVRNVVDRFPFWTTAQLTSRYLASSNLLSELEADMKSCQTMAAYHCRKFEEIYAELTKEYGEEKVIQMKRPDYSGVRPMRYGQMGPHYNSYQAAQIEFTDIQEHLGKLLDANKAMRAELDRRMQFGQK